jgi:hypothetical protein
MPALARVSSGLAALLVAAPVCRAVGVTNDRRTARRIGIAVLGADLVAASVALTARRPSSRRHAALGNALLDLAGGTSLGAFALRRRGGQRVLGLGLAAFLGFGSTEWLRAYARIEG